jgi:hypothetical protein
MIITVTIIATMLLNSVQLNTGTIEIPNIHHMPTLLIIILTFYRWSKALEAAPSAALYCNRALAYLRTEGVCVCPVYDVCMCG